MRVLFRFWCAATLLATVSACTNSDLPDNARPTFPTTVTVTYKGAPVADATVMFVEASENPAPAYGKTDAQGVAKMKTYVEGDGAVAGKHDVVITKAEAVGGAPAVDQDSAEYDPNKADMPAAVKSLIPQKYGSKVTSGLTAEVKESGPNEFKFDLTD